MTRCAQRLFLCSDRAFSTRSMVCWPKPSIRQANTKDRAMKLQAREKSALKLLVAAALLLLLVLNASTAWGLLGTLWAFSPLSCSAASWRSCSTSPWKALERVFFPRSTHPFMQKARRPSLFYSLPAYYCARACARNRARGSRACQRARPSLRARPSPP